MAAIGSLIPAAYYFLNGMMDGRVPVTVRTVISDKYISSDEYGIHYDLACGLSWDQQTLDETFAVSREVFAAAEKGGSVRVLIHPGAFSQLGTAMFNWKVAAQAIRDNTFNDACCAGLIG